MKQKSQLVVVIFMLLTSFVQAAFGQEVKSYSCTGSVDNFGNFNAPIGMVAAVATFNDNMLEIWPGGKFVLAQVNNDGSKVYQNTTSADSFNPAFVVVASDASTFKEVFQYQMMGVNFSHSTFFQYIGEGKEPALRMAELERRIQQGRDPFQEYRDYKKLR